MLSFIIPSADYTSFKAFLTEREKLSMSRTERGAFSRVNYDRKIGQSEEIPSLQTLASHWQEFCNSDKSGAVVIPDKGQAILYRKYVDVTHYDLTGMSGESAFHRAMQEKSEGLESPLPIVIETGTGTNYTNRLMPTVVLQSHSMRDYQGGIRTSGQAIPIYLGDYSVMAWFPSGYNAEGLYLIHDYPNAYFATPYAMVGRNAEGLGNTVFLCNSLWDSSNGGEKQIYDLLLEPEVWTKVLIPLATLSWEDAKSMWERTQLPDEVQLEMFRQIFQQGMIAELEALKASREQQANSVTEYIKRITNAKISLAGLESQIMLKQREIDNNKSMKKVEKSFQELRSLPYLESFVMKGGTVSFYTKPIPIDETGPVLGPYKIQYKFSDKSLKIWNEGNPADDRGRLLSHPHCDQGGYPCFGNYTDIVYSFETGDFYSAMEFMHEFLGTYNPEDCWGRRLFYFDAKWTAEDMKQRGLSDYIEAEFARLYRDATGETLRNADDYCPDCDRYRDECECERCENCGHRVADCDCTRCRDCNELVLTRSEIQDVADGRLDIHTYCTCDRCPECNSLLRDCNCERCSVCNMLLEGEWEHDHCDCPRCVDSGELMATVTQEMCENCDTQCHNSLVEEMAIGEAVNE